MKIQRNIKEKVMAIIIICLSLSCLFLITYLQRILRITEINQSETSFSCEAENIKTINEKTESEYLDINQKKQTKEALLDRKYYLVFYGEWIVTDIVDGPGDNERANEILSQYMGKYFYFDFNLFAVDDEVIAINEDLKYDLSLIPTDSYYYYFNERCMYKDIEDIILQDQNYFTKVIVRTRDIYAGLGHEFYIKDEDTIIMPIHRNGVEYYIKCERVSYIDDYEMLIGEP